ncbi:MAG: radical SAM protein [Elusimicrobiota bacterium]|nr:radical SAM protein [Elusimicrobiota bacterium]
MKKFMPMIINKVFLCLGFECNLNCIYCIQKESKPQTGDKKIEINPDIYPFIKGLLKNSPSGHQIRVIFYGGEPLLYLDKIKTIVKKLKNKKIHFQIITNGKLLNEETIKFLNKNKITVQLSWDGSISQTARGYDVVADKKEALFQIKNMALTAVLSKNSRLKDVVEQMDNADERYFKTTGRHLHNSIFALNDMESDFSLSRDFNFELLASDVKDFIEEFFIKKLHPSFMEFFYSILQSINFFYKKHNGNYIAAMPYCGEGYSALSLSIDGSILRCHNRNEKTGDIYTPFWVYLNNVLSRQIICKKTDCSVYGICRGGCKLQTERQLENGTYCDFQKAMYEPILNFTQSIGQGGGKC